MSTQPASSSLQTEPADQKRRLGGASGAESVGAQTSRETSASGRRRKAAGAGDGPDVDAQLGLELMYDHQQPDGDPGGHEARGPGEGQPHGSLLPGQRPRDAHQRGEEQNGRLQRGEGHLRHREQDHLHSVKVEQQPRKQRHDPRRVGQSVPRQEHQEAVERQHRQGVADGLRHQVRRGPLDVPQGLLQADDHQPHAEEHPALRQARRHQDVERPPRGLERGHEDSHDQEPLHLRHPDDPGGGGRHHSRPALLPLSQEEARHQRRDAAYVQVAAPEEQHHPRGGVYGDAGQAIETVVEELPQRSRRAGPAGLLAVHRVRALIEERGEGDKEAQPPGDRRREVWGVAPQQQVGGHQRRKADDGHQIRRQPGGQALGQPHPPGIQQVVQRRVAARVVRVLRDALQPVL
mmetsp:Transcript_85564/g.223247  ORF Transcript_85564/g.223247 Transcript_85564/m.223247 type:complete len:406 (-) Transcript_85564:69-1286(-)